MHNFIINKVNNRFIYLNEDAGLYFKNLLRLVQEMGDEKINDNKI